MNANFWSHLIVALSILVPMQAAIASPVMPDSSADDAADEFAARLDYPSETVDAAPLVARVTNTAIDNLIPDLPPLHHEKYLLDEDGNLRYRHGTDSGVILIIEEGEASWYGPGFDGQPTANGEIFDQYAISAAHPTLPFNTIVRVVNLNNGRELEVRINDRGPYAGRRVIDLSLAAAEELGFVADGVTYVSISIVE